MMTVPGGVPERRPIAEMTPQEQAEWALVLSRHVRRKLAELNRPDRERKLRRPGEAQEPRAEWDLFATDLRERRQVSDELASPQAQDLREGRFKGEPTF